METTIKLAGSPTAPAVASTAVAWYKADALSLSDGDAVGTWADSTANGNDATQGTAGSKPTFKTNIINGKPAVLFDGSADHLAANGVAASFTGTDKPLTLLVVVKPVIADGLIAGLGRSSTNVPYTSFGVSGTTWAAERRDDANTYKDGLRGTVTTAATLVVLSFTGTTATVYVTGTQAGATIDLDVGALTLDRFTIGALVRTNVLYYFSGHIAELLVYDSALSTTDLDDLTQYLAAKYSLLAAWPDITAYAKMETVKASSVLTSQIDTAGFEIRFSGTDVDIAEKREVLIHKAGDATVKYFGGYVTLLDGSSVGPEKILQVNCQDYTCLLETTKVNRIYLASTDQAIIQSLFTTYLPEIDTATYVGASLTHDQISFGHDESLRDAMDTLSDAAGWDWYVDYDKKLHYFDPSVAGAASFSLSSSPNNVTSFGYSLESYNTDASKIANRVTVGGGKYKSGVTEFYMGSDGLVELALPYPLFAPPGATAISVWRNDGTEAVPTWTSLTVGAGNVQNTADYQVLHHDSPPKLVFAVPPRPYDTNAVKILASYEAPLLVTETSVTSYSTYGRYFDEYINDASIDNIPLAIQRAQGILLDRALAKESISLKCWEDGLSSGQLLTIVNATHGINGAYIVRNVSLSLRGNGLVEYSVSAGEYNPDFLQLIIRQKRLAQRPPTAEQAKMHELLSLSDAGVITDDGVVLTDHAKGDYLWDGNSLWDFATWGTATEFMLNGDFETAGGGGADVFGTWIENAGTGTIQDSATAHAGSHAAKLTCGVTDTAYIYQSLTTLTPEVTHALTFWTRGDGTNAGRYHVYDVTHAAFLITANTSTGVTAATYAQVTNSFTPPAGCLEVWVTLKPPAGNTQYAYFDDVSVLDT